MAQPPPPVGFDEIQHEELSRLARFLVDMRVARVGRILAAFAVLVLLRPNLPRVGVLGLGALALVGFSLFERRRFDRRGYSREFVPINAVIMGGLHFVVFLTTGALESPLVPGMVAFSVIIGLMAGRQPGRLAFVWFQVATVWALVGVHALGWAEILAPTWLRPETSAAHLLLKAGVLTGLVAGLSRGGTKVRDLFDTMVRRALDARQDLLVAHREQAEELTALSGAIAHELKNPLASVKGLAGLLARDVPEGKPAERLGVLRGEVDRMQGILDEFLNFSRPAVPLSTEDVELGALCADVAALHEGLARDRGVRLRVAGQGRARLDARKTRQVLINLVQNAIDASPTGGEVALTVARGTSGLRVDVEDEGGGVDPAVRDRVFEAGVTTKARGSGLGLTIARALARQQGGDLALVAREGRGTRAEVSLPAGGDA